VTAVSSDASGGVPAPLMNRSRFPGRWRKVLRSVVSADGVHGFERFILQSGRSTLCGRVPLSCGSWVWICSEPLPSHESAGNGPSQWGHRALLSPPPLPAGTPGPLTPMLVMAHPSLTAPEVAATAAPETPAPPSRTRHGQSTRRPWLVYRAASVSLRLFRWSARAGATPGAGRPGASNSCGTSDTRPAAGVSRSRRCRA
jgi:hypothetical protein